MSKILPIKIFSLMLLTVCVYAGNPDRQGEAGAYELLMNPWARSSGLNGLNSAYVSGAEAGFLNPAGISRINKTQLILAHTRWLVPSDMNINALGFAQKVGKNGALGITLMALDFGDIKVTTTNAPEGTGAYYSPSFFNIGLGYSHNFANKVTVGVQFKGISEAIKDINAFGLGIDAGVQYVAGANDKFKLGISIRNVGGPMKFGGEGLATQLSSSEGTKLTYDVRLSEFNLPSLLHIGVSYDIPIKEDIKVIPMFNFTSNSFGRDEIGLGAELMLTKYLSLRGAYKYEIKSNTEQKTAYTGLAAGMGITVPMKKKSENMVSFEYAYRPSNPFQGTHNLGVRLDF